MIKFFLHLISLSLLVVLTYREVSYNFITPPDVKELHQAVGVYEITSGGRKTSSREKITLISGEIIYFNCALGGWGSEGSKRGCIDVDLIKNIRSKTVHAWWFDAPDYWSFPAFLSGENSHYLIQLEADGKMIMSYPKGVQKLEDAKNWLLPIVLIVVILGYVIFLVVWYGFRLFFM